MRLTKKVMKHKVYVVKFVNYGEVTEAYHSGKSIKKILKQYKLEQLPVVSIREVNPNAN